MPNSEPFLKALFVLKRRKAGGFDSYFSRTGNFDSEEAFMACSGWRSWQEVQDGRPGQLPGFVAVQMRPRVSLLFGPDGKTIYADADYETPFPLWKFALRHQPFELPGWVHVAEVKAACVKLLPLWAKFHLVSGRRAEVRDGQAIAALSGAEIVQRGGSVWGYKDSHVEQAHGCCCATYLHDNCWGIIRTIARAADNSTADVQPSGQVQAFGQATIILHPGQWGQVGRFTAYGPGVRVFRSEAGRLAPVEFDPLPEPSPFTPTEGQAVFAPFNMPVD